MLIYFGLTVVVVLALGFAFVPSLAGGGQAAKRRKSLTAGNGRRNKISGRSIERDRDERRKNLQTALKEQSKDLDKRLRKPSLQQRIYQAGFKISIKGFIRNSVIVGVVIGLVCWIMDIPILIAIVFGCTSGYLLPRMFLANRRKAFQKKFLEEFPNAVDTIVRGVRSGLPLNDSIHVVARELKEPVRGEFVKVLEQQSVGKTIQESVEILFDRVPTPEVNLFIVVINVQQTSGGNLSEALGNLSKVLRDRKKMKAKIKAMSSEAKASAGIIGSLPFAVGTMVSIVSPAYLAPLFTTNIGYFWLGVAFCMMSMGTFVMVKMVQFDF